MKENPQEFEARIRANIPYWTKRGNFRAINRAILRYEDEIRSFGFKGSDLLQVFFYNSSGHKTNTPTCSGEKIETLARWLDRGWKLPPKKVQQICFAPALTAKTRESDTNLLVHIMRLHVRHPKVLPEPCIEKDPRFVLKLNMIMSIASYSRLSNQAKRFVQFAQQIPHLQLHTVHSL